MTVNVGARSREGTLIMMDPNLSIKALHFVEIVRVAAGVECVEIGCVWIVGILAR
jgi:hypothetical protein